MLSNLLEITRANGGATIDLLGASPDSGFQVGIRARDGLVLVDQFASQGLIDTWIQDHLEILARPDHYVGTWIHEGRIYLDVSVNVHHLEDAIDLARANGQLAIWDVTNQAEIEVGE